jgi:cyclopropane fatty-acyl-phospholipid synthase-like methyltransferase
MERNQLFKQMMDFNRMAFNYSFSAVTMFHDLVEQTTGAVLEQSAWLPEDGKRSIHEWVGNFKKGREDFKKMVDEGFNRMESLFAGAEI